jgi:hypothetical protein
MCFTLKSSHAGVELTDRQKGGTLPAEPQAVGVIWYRSHDLAAWWLGFIIYTRNDLNAIIPMMCAIFLFNKFRMLPRLVPGVLSSCGGLGAKAIMWAIKGIFWRRRRILEGLGENV